MWLFKAMNLSITKFETCYYKSQAIVRTTQGLLHRFILIKVK